jgi:3-hydroxyacyl-CoA dehydrogenase
MVAYETVGEVGVITLDNPPVNTLGATSRRDLLVALDRAAADSQIRSVVLIGRGRVFSAGADIDAIEDSDISIEPTLNGTILARLDDFPKPVVAALHGAALGGGLELALGSHYRIASPNTRVGLPEITLGLIPGAGGTQRLPRAIGLEKALNLIITGRSAKVEELPGVIDAILEGELLAKAVNYARQIAEVRPLPRLRDRSVGFPNAQGFLAIARMAARSRRQASAAAVACVDALECAVTHPFDEAVRCEFKSFQTLALDGDGKALRHLFRAERATTKVAMTGLRIVRSAGVIGAGAMGRGIAISFADAGIPVVLVETKPDVLEAAMASIRATYAGAATRGRITQGDANARLALVRPELSYGPLSEIDLAIEAVFEDMAVKRSVFEKLDGVMKPGAILASNTSSLNLNLIARSTRRPADVVGLHFFNPANIMRLLEIVRGEATAPDVLATAIKLAIRLGKVPVVSGVCDGFIGNRMMEQYTRQAFALLDEGALPWQVDRALEAFGMAMGPFRVLDVVGGDIPWAVRKRRYVERPEIIYSRIADKVCERGWFGQKTGRGWYRYEPGRRDPVPDQDVRALIEEHSFELDIVRRNIHDREIVERCVFALVNEGAAILDEGIAARGSDIDVAYVHGYGFPAARGGPMFYADTIGLPMVLRAMRTFAARSDQERAFWNPSALLDRFAEAGRRLSSPSPVSA